MTSRSSSAMDAFFFACFSNVGKSPCVFFVLRLAHDSRLWTITETIYKHSVVEFRATAYVCSCYFFTMVTGSKRRPVVGLVIACVVVATCEKIRKRLKLMRRFALLCFPAGVEALLVACIYMPL